MDARDLLRVPSSKPIYPFGTGKTESKTHANVANTNTNTTSASTSPETNTKVTTTNFNRALALLARIRWFNLSIELLLPLGAAYGLFYTRTPRRAPTLALAFLCYFLNMLGALPFFPSVRFHLFFDFSLSLYTSMVVFFLMRTYVNSIEIVNNVYSSQNFLQSSCFLLSSFGLSSFIKLMHITMTQSESLSSTFTLILYLFIFKTKIIFPQP